MRKKKKKLERKIKNIFHSRKVANYKLLAPGRRRKPKEEREKKGKNVEPIPWQQ